MRAMLGIVLLVALAALPVPEAATPGDVCVPACTVVGAMNAFTPGKVALVSGSSVTWTSPSIEQVHTATGVDGVRGCLNVVFNPGAEKSVRFDVGADGLYATVPGGTPTRCAAAVEVADGVLRLEYVCLYHPPMVGELYVAAA